MEKRFQAFVSSTFTELKDERQAAIKSILELDHMPAGMELFPAADDAAWHLIRDVIDASDYYVLIIGGRYGSLDEAGLGYTEKEYDYAISTSKSVLALLHEKPDNLPRDKTETNEQVWQKLVEFRSKIERRHTCVYWNNAEQLKSKLIVGLTAEIKRRPAIGWVKADKVPNQATLADILALRAKVSELEQQLQEEREGPPPGTAELLQGDEFFKVSCTFQSDGSKSEPGKRLSWKASMDLSWNQMFAAIAPALIHEASDAQLRHEFHDFFERRGHLAWEDDKELKGRALDSFLFKEDEITTCIIQLRALGLIQESSRKRSVHDKGNYWVLTRFGDRLMVQLRALRRNPPPSATPGSLIAGKQK